MKFSEAIVKDKAHNINWINNLRLVAIFAMIVLHTAAPLLARYKQSSPADWLTADFYNALVRFAVPVFVMITGALSLHRQYHTRDFLKKRIGRLVIPFVFWSLVYIAYKFWNEEFTFTGNLWPDVKFVFQQFQTGAYYHLWYVYLLLGLYLLIPVLAVFVQQCHRKADSLFHRHCISEYAYYCSAPGGITKPGEFT